MPAATKKPEKYWNLKRTYFYSYLVKKRKKGYQEMEIKAAVMKLLGRLLFLKSGQSIWYIYDGVNI